VVAWEPVESGASARVAGLDVTVTTAPGAALVPLPSPASAGAEKPARVAAVFEVPSGPFSLKYNARDADKATVDAWSQALTAPDWSAAPLAISTPRFFLAQSVQELRAIRAAGDPAPSALRQFRRSDRVLVAIDCYASAPDAAPSVQAHILTRDGKELAELPVPALQNGSVLFELPVGSLGQGTYILRIRATLGADQTEDMTAIVIAR
jgi:hypothetical protein